SATEHGRCGGLPSAHAAVVRKAPHRGAFPSVRRCGRGDGPALMGGTRRLEPHAADGPLHRGIAAIRDEQKLPAAFPPEVEAAAVRAAAAPRLPELDRSDIPLVTIDPPGAMDLDQALHVERRGDGFRVHYAIA